MKRTIVVTAMAMAIAGCVPAINEEATGPVALRDHRIAIAAAGGAPNANAHVGGDHDYIVTHRLSVGGTGRRYLAGDVAWSSALAFGYSMLGVPLLPDLHVLAGTGVVGDAGGARIAMLAGVGNRWFLTDYLAIGAAVRDTIFVAPMTADMPSRLDGELTFDLSLTVFLPLVPLRSQVPQRY